MVLGHLQDMAQAINYISKSSFNHVNNNHKALKKGQVKDLKDINNGLRDILSNTQEAFEDREFSSFIELVQLKQQLLTSVNSSIEKQISRIRTDETSPKNSTLYFSLLLETKDLISSIISLIQLFEEFYIVKEIQK